MGLRGRITRGRADSEPLHLLIDAQGDIGLTSKTTQTWPGCVPGAEAALRRAAADFARSAGLSSSAAAGGRLLTLTRLANGSGEPRVHVVAQISQAWELPRRFLLTERQLKIANAAATGATANEIAEATGVSIDTVKQHLKAAYRALGVHNRVGLMARLRDD